MEKVIEPVKVKIQEVTEQGQVQIKFNQKLIVPRYNKTVFEKKKNDKKRLLRDSNHAILIKAGKS